MTEDTMWRSDLFGDLRPRNFHEIEDYSYGEGYRAKFGLVIEAMQSAKISFIPGYPGYPVTLTGPGSGFSDAVSMKMHKLPLTDPRHLILAVRKLVPEDRLCQLSPTGQARWNPENHGDDYIDIYLHIGYTKKELIEEELRWFYAIKHDPIAHFYDKNWPDTVVSMKTWLKVNQEFLQPSWKDFPELDKNL